ncbi:hypothetical protein RQM59_14055 [Flavobacteriaceae bacterium S356]|uniref:TonB-dependent receptor n=1 Tax=Asprobacillus argus TaxID=3076534 RepID=A0ABU3LIP3_9FLAO|nr:hypothetical protein [Flavobacteriaceae bacterium S356]
MKKFLLLLGVVFGSYQASAQKEEKKETAKDTLKPEVINVVTSYTPTIADAFKIKKNPKIVLSEKSQKKKLKYTIFSAPVASTFIPKSGVVKGIDLGVKERLYDNYLAAGFGNYATPFVELFLHQNTKHETDFGIYAKYISSENGVADALLNNGYRNLNLGGYYMKEERYFNWKVGVDVESNQYNWYGLPALTFDVPTLNAIEEKQKFKYFSLNGEMIFEDAYIENANAKIYSFSDDFKSKELFFSLAADLQLPLTALSRKLKNLNVNTSLTYLSGEFMQDYLGTTKQEYSFFNFKVNPTYRFGDDKLKVKAGAKVYLALDTQNSLTDFFIYPDIEISYPIVKSLAYLNLGAGGDLEMNSYRNFSNSNPFVSPTLFMTQTNEQYNFFASVNGKFSPNVTYQIKGSYRNEEDKPLFIRNNSKSDGTTNIANSIPLLGYEYGNSFNVFYDDVKTFTFYSELEVDVSKRMMIGANLQFHSYTLTGQQEAWNLPKVESTIYGKYKKDKWYAGADLFFVGERKDILYGGIFPSATSGVQNLKSYLDLNLNGGYHFSDMLSAFVKFNNVLNSDYQRYANFTVQGFQVIAGITYKFDF